MLQQLLPSPFHVFFMPAISSVSYITGTVFNGEIIAMIVESYAKIVEDDGALNKFGSSLHTPDPKPCLQRIKPLLEHSKGSFDCASCLFVGFVESQTGTFHITSEGRDQPILARIGRVAQDDGSRKWSSPIILECRPKRTLS